MEKYLLKQFNIYITEGKATKALQLSALDGAEKETFEFLKENNIRLEQEKITQDFIERYLQNLILNS